MDNIILDECLSNILESEKLMREYVSFDEFTMIFEADDPKVKEQEKKNESIVNKVVEKLKKALAALKDFFNRLVESIKNFIDLRKMDKAEKEAYYAFKEAVKKDPSLKDTKITVRDYSQVLEEYSKDMNEYGRVFEKYYSTPSDELSDRLSDILDSGMKKTGDLAKAAPTAVSVETALRMAAGNKKYAKELADQLKNDKATMDALEKRLGEKNAKKVEKDIKSLQHTISFTRLKMKLTHRAAKTLDEATFGVYEDVAKGVYNVSELINDHKSDDSDNDLIDNVKQVVKSSKSLKRSGVLNALGNPTISSGMKASKKVGATALANAIDASTDDTTIYGNSLAPKNLAKRGRNRAAKSIEKKLHNTESPTALEPFFTGYDIGRSGSTDKKKIKRVKINDLIDKKGNVVNAQLFRQAQKEDRDFFDKVRKEQEKRRQS